MGAESRGLDSAPTQVPLLSHVRAVRRSWLTLRFADSGTEQAFLEYHSRLAALHTRIGAVAGIVIFNLGVLLVEWGSPDLAIVARPVIYGLVIPVLVLTFILSFLKLPDWGRQLVGYLDMAATAGAIVIIAALSPAEIESAFGSGRAALFQHMGVPALFLIIVVTCAYVRLRFIWVLGTVPALIWMGWIASQLTQAPPAVQATNLIAFSALVVISVSLTYLVEAYTRDSWLGARELEFERERSDSLLRNILPSHIVTRLKDGEEIIADEFSDVTILFADVVGFTRLSEQIGPMRLLKLLDELFLKFDEIADGLGVEKIETAGDGYLAAGGAPSALDDHPQAVAAMALAMTAAAAEVEIASGEYVQVRIGMHTGPVIGGVIGKKRLRYNLFGSTVNVASRIEGQSAPNRVLVSAATYKRLQARFCLEPHDTVDLKGHGPMRTWWLVGEIQQANFGAAKEQQDPYGA